MRNCVRRVAAFLAAGFLGACTVSSHPYSVATQGPLGNWEVALLKDEVFGNSRVATLSTNPNVNFETGEVRAGKLDLLCFKSKPVVRLRFNYKVGSNRSADFSYRFDDKPGVETKANFLRNYSSVTLDDPSEVRRFLTDLATASKLYMRVDSLIVGRTNIEMNVQGAAAAMDAVLSACPLPAAVAHNQA